MDRQTIISKVNELKALIKKEQGYLRAIEDGDQIQEVQLSKDRLNQLQREMDALQPFKKQCPYTGL